MSDCESDQVLLGSISTRRVRGNLVDTTTWPHIDEGALDEARRTRYLERKLAVERYLAGASDEAVKEATSIGSKQAYRLTSERCLEVNEDDHLLWGWRALVPDVRIKKYKRRTKIVVNEFGHGAVGALGSVLDREPTLRLDFDKRITSTRTSLTLKETNITCRRHCRWFLDKLKGLGYEARGEWPFNTASLGYGSIVKYVNELLEANPKSLAASVGGNDLVRKLETGDGTRRPVLKFMQRVEMDAHKLDGRFIVSIKPTLH